MRISIIVEGKTERAFLVPLRHFLQPRLEGRMPKLDVVPYDGRIPTGTKLQRVVQRLIDDRNKPADAVIALTDVYTGTQPPVFQDAAEARRKMRQWVGTNDKFFPHASQHDFEAWLLSYWHKIQMLAGSTRTSPGVQPELINHMNPPAHRLQEVFRNGSRGRAYVKTRDAIRILEGEDLLQSADKCSELKDFLNTILRLCKADTII